MTLTRREFARLGAVAGLAATAWRWVRGEDASAPAATAQGGCDSSVVVDGCGGRHKVPGAAV